MDALVAQVLRDAKGIAKDIATRPGYYADEAQSLKKRMAEIQTVYDAARDAPERLARFQDVAKSGRDVLCPSCFLEGRPMAFMVRVPGNEHHDLFMCQACDYDVSIEI